MAGRRVGGGERDGGMRLQSTECGCESPVEACFRMDSMPWGGDQKRGRPEKEGALFDWGGDSPGGFLRKGRACERSIIEMPAARWGMATGAAPLKAGTEATRESCRAHDAHTRLSHSAAERGLAAIQHGRATVRADQKGRNGASTDCKCPDPAQGTCQGSRRALHHHGCT